MNYKVEDKTGYYYHVELDFSEKNRDQAIKDLEHLIEELRKNAF